MKVSPETLAALEFSVVRDLLAQRTMTPMGRPLALTLAPLPTPGEISRSLDETDEAARLLELGDGLPLRGLEQVLDVLEAVRPEGSLLTGKEILSVTRFCAVVEDTRSFRSRLKDGFPILAGRIGLLPDLASIVRTILGKISPTGQLEDSASAELARLRGRIQSTTAALHARLEAILAREDSGKFLSDSFITERGGRFVIPVRSDSAFMARGIVHGGSSSGATLFVEPLATVEQNNELVRLREAELAETERILRIWTERLRERLDDLLRAADEIARLDLAQAKGRLARDLGAVRPALGEGGTIALSGAKHPLLEMTLRASGHDMVPIDLVLPEGSRTLIVSGPNAGGKTIVLKTVGLLALMAHAGLRVPAEEGSFPFLRQVLVDIGDRQSIEGSLSTFSAHIENLSDIATHLEPPCLVLIDEIGTGTDPVEGGALAVALLEWLRARGALTIATTHHGPVKVYGIETPGVASASVEFDEETLAPTYRLLAGIAGASSGLAIAERLGLDPAIVADAARRIEPGDREGESYLRRLRDLVSALESDRRELEALRLRLEADARRARDEAIRSDHERAETFRGEMAAALEDFRVKARAHLEGLADRKETIRLEKDRLARDAELRREFERITKAAGPTEPLPEKGRRKESRTGARDSGGPGRISKSAPARSGSSETERGRSDASLALDQPSRALEPGDAVLIGPYGREGKVESIEGEKVTVLIGSARFHVRPEDCRPPERGERLPAPLWKAARTKPAAGQPEGRAPASEINLIGFTVEEGTGRLDKFLDDAFLSGLGEVRVVHGHGSGRLRAAVRDLLSRHPHVASHRPGDPREGGDGATIALLHD